MTPLKRLLHGSSALDPRVHMPQVAVPWLVGTLGVSTFVASAIYYIGTSLVTSWLLKALAPKPSDMSRGMLTNNLDGTAPQQYVYGQVRKGGTIVFYESTGASNKYLHMVVALAGHEVEEIGNIYVNDKVVTLDGSGFVTSTPWNSKIRIKKHLGSEMQTVDSDLLAETSVTSDFRGKGIAYIYARLEYNQDVFTNGIPTITALVKGKKVYDPRTATTAWSRNAALCVRDYLTDVRGMADTAVDDTMFSVAANVCDEAVPLTGGGTEPRYRMDGVVQSDTAPGDVLQNMMTSCAGTLFWGQGAWKLKVGYYTAPVKTFTLDDLRSNITLQTRASMSDSFNAVQGTFNDAAQDWITADFPKIGSTVFVAEDNGVESVLDLPLSLTTSASMAQRIAKLSLFRGREQMTFSAEFGTSALEVQVGDIVAITMDRYGWAAKEFEVTGWKFFSASDNGDLRVTMTLRETSEAAFDWDAEEETLLMNNSTLPDPWEVPSLGLSVTSETRVIFEKLTNVIRIDVTATATVYVERVEVQFKKSTESTWRVVGVGTLGGFEVIDVDDALYDIRVRAYNQFGVRGEWQSYGSYQVAGLATPPQTVVNLHGYASGGTVVLEWTPVSDADLSFYTVRYAIEELGATFANATTAIEKVPRPGSNAIMPARPGTYMVRAVDKTGNASAGYTSVVITEASFEQFANTMSLTDSPTFSGTKTNCSVTSGALRITSGTSATYQFSTHIDTGTARRIRARTDVTLVRYDPGSGLFDSIAGLFDAIPGMFDDFTGGSNFSDVDVVMYIRSTNDNPGGTPTWGPWTIYKGGDFYGRAFQFKVDLLSDTSGITPSITALTARVWYN